MQKFEWNYESTTSQFCAKILIDEKTFRHHGSVFVVKWERYGKEQKYREWIIH